MSQSPVVSFGLALTSAAYKAKSDQCRLRDRLALAENTLRLAAGDPDACAAVADFLRTVDRDPRCAGVRLQGFLDEWLARCSPQEAQAVAADPDIVRLFEWQERADLR